jgi:hypothetical protein
MNQKTISRKFLSCMALGTAIVLTNMAMAKDLVRVCDAPGTGQPLAAKTDAKGVIHLVMNSPEGPLYSSSVDNGQSFSTPVSVLVDAPMKPGLEYLAWDMTVSPDGHVHVAMGTNAWKLKLPKDEWGFFYARLAPGHSSFSKLQNINHQPSEGFSLAANKNGDVTACWLAEKLYANVSHDNGLTFGKTIEINPEINPCNCCTTSATYGVDGRLAILYREETRNERDMHLVLWNQKDNSVVRSLVSQESWTIDTCPMTYYSITPDGNGYLAVWPTKGPIYFNRLSADGKLMMPREVKTPGTTGMRTGMIGLQTADESTLVAWVKDEKIGWQAYDSSGGALGSSHSESCSGKGVAGVVTTSGEFLLFR